MKIKEFSNWIFDDGDLETYSSLIQISKKDLSETFSPPCSFFHRRLRDFRKRSSEITASNIIAYMDNEPIGWGHLSYDISNSDNNELYVYLKPEFRYLGYGSKMCEFMLNRLPDSVTEIIVPVIGDNRNFIEKTFYYELIDTEVRAVLNLTSMKLKVENVYSVYDENSIVEKHDLVKQVFNVSNEGVAKQIDEIVRHEEILGKKHLFVINEDDGKVLNYVHLIHNTEDNEELALFIDDKNFNIKDREIQLDMKRHAIDYLIDSTKVRAVLSFNNLDSYVDRSLGFKYLNTFYNYKIIRKGKYMKRH